MSIAALRDENEHLKALLAQTQAALSEHQGALAADSDDLARVYRFDLAQDSEMISPTIPI